MPHFAPPDPVEDQERMARLQEEAGKAYASELSATTDPKRREFLMRKANHAKEAAAFHRETAERLRQESR